MTRSKTSTLIGGAIAAVLGSAAALANGPTTAPAAANVFYIGGGSAEPQAVAVATCSLLANVDSYSTAAVGQVGANYLLLYGNIKAATGTIAAGTPVAIMYKFNGGSFPNGGQPQAAPYPTLAYPTVATAFQVPAGGGPGNYCTAGVGTTTVTDTTAYALTDTKNPAFGLTDLEPAAFSGINNPLAPAPLPIVDNHTGIYDLVFGIAVSNALWTQKQNFSYAEVAGILAGAITNWNQLYGDQPGFVNQALPSGNIIFLDRNVGSGHKASSSTEFLGYPQLGGSSFQPNSVAGTGYTGSAVTCGTGYQDVMEGSAGATVTDLKLLNQTTAKGGCGGLRAFAILSMDNPPAFVSNQNNPGTNDYDFVSLDGSFVDANTSTDNENSAASTSYDNVLKGNYRWFYQASFNTAKSTAPQYNTTNYPNAVAIAAAYQTALKSPTLPGCAAGVGFPAAAPGIVIDLSTTATLGKCVTTATRGGNSDGLLFPYSTDSGNITLGSDPLH